MDTNAQLGMISICRMPGGPGPAATTATAMGLPRTPSLVAVMVAVPGATPVTTPFDATAAIVGSVLAHWTARPTMPPRVSLATARSANDRLTVMSTRRGDTSIEATLESTTGAGSLTVTIAAPVLPRAAVAVTEAAPTFRPVTMPFGVTLATDESLEAQATGRGRAWPSAARGVAASATVPPTVMAAMAGVTLTFARVATGGAASDRTTSHTPTAAEPASGTTHQNRAVRASAPAVRTSTVAVPLWFSQTAVTRAAPSETPRTKPSVETSTIARSLDPQRTAGSRSGRPSVPRASAWNRADRPTRSTRRSGRTWSDATRVGVVFDSGGPSVTGVSCPVLPTPASSAS